MLLMRPAYGQLGLEVRSQLPSTIGLRRGVDIAAGTRRRRLGGQELVEQLNDVVAQLIKENGKLKRQVDKFSRRGTSAASGTVERSLRTIQRRAQKELAEPAKRRRRRPTSSATKKAIRRPRATEAAA